MRAVLAVLLVFVCVAFASTPYKYALGKLCNVYGSCDKSYNQVPQYADEAYSGDNHLPEYVDNIEKCVLALHSSILTI